MNMFAGISSRMKQVFRKLKGWGKLSEANIEEALREVRMAFLEADVHYQVTNDFLNQVKFRAQGREVAESLTPGQQFIKIVQEEMTRILGEKYQGLELDGPRPTGVMLVGLQGSGKTTSAAKLARYLKRTRGKSPLLLALDTQRPAAGEQLSILAEKAEINFFRGEKGQTGPEIIRAGKEKARETQSDVLVVDTAGRLHIDRDMMAELVQIQRELLPRETLMVVDAMGGQDAVRAVQDFAREIEVTGIVLSKLDGDARGGAALSIRAASGIPIKFLGVGEKEDDLEVFYPERLAGRILGMGDILSLIEKTESVWEEAQAEKMRKKLRSGDFDLDDFLGQLRMLKKVGSFESLIGMIPGGKNLLPHPGEIQRAEGEIKRFEAIINSMTPGERENPLAVNGSRRRRIASGSGTTPAEVNRLLKRFREVKKLVKIKPGRKFQGSGIPFASGAFRI